MTNISVLMFVNFISLIVISLKITKKFIYIYFFLLCNLIYNIIVGYNYCNEHIF